MKIVCIFADQLFAFHYKNEKENSLKKILALWNNPDYIYEFLKENAADIKPGKNIAQLTDEIIEDRQYS